MCPNYPWVALPVTIILSNLLSLTEHPPFLGTGWTIEAKSPCLWEVAVLEGTRWSEKHSCLKFNFNVLWILFPLERCRGSGPKTVSGWRGIEKRKTKNDKEGKQWYILTWEITEKRLQGVDVGVCKWYVNVTSTTAQIVTVLLFYIVECWSLGIFSWDLSCKLTDH